MVDLAAQSIALALGISALVTAACRKIGFPALLPLLAVGLGLGQSGTGLIDGASLGEALKGIVTVAIGLLVFEGALHLNRSELSQAPRAVWSLLTIGALITWLCGGTIAHLILDLSIPLAAILGAALIVTGPTAVQPILRLMRVSPRLHAALGAEAVLIDPIGAVATIATLEVVRLYVSVGPGLHVAGQGFWLFLKPLLGGAGVGVALGVAGHFLLRRLDRLGKLDSKFLNLFAVGLCMTCVGIGEAITPDAGLAAVTICGIWVANARVLGATELRLFKELLATMLVGTLFVLLASRFDAKQLLSITSREVLFVALLLVVVRPLNIFASTWKSKLSWRERVFASVFAPRGIVALSVMAIVAAELSSGFAQLEEGERSVTAEMLAAEAPRLETIMFVTIVGTVLVATTLSPLLAWLLRVRAGRGNAVILIGAHPLSLAFARALRVHDIHVRLVDSNIARVNDISREGFDAVAGDATDIRWLDDAGSSQDAGWVVAWTGNVDVDQVAGRWGEDRYGIGHSVMWSNKPPRGELQRLDVGAGVELEAVLSGMGSGRYRMADVSSPAKLSRLLAWIDQGIVTVTNPGSRPLGEGNGRRFIGLKEQSDLAASDSSPNSSPA